MNEKQRHELAYWADRIDRCGGWGKFLEYRAGGYEYRIEQFPEFKEEIGKGLDLGCGLLSVFEWSDKDVVAIDPLLERYKKLGWIDSPRVRYIEVADEYIPAEDQSFDWVFCYNVIDHTPNPKLMADEAWRVLKPGGKLYFEVNFDDFLTGAHYEKWNEFKVQEIMAPFKLVREKKMRGVDDKRDTYFAIYVK